MELKFIYFKLDLKINVRISFIFTSIFGWSNKSCMKSNFLSLNGKAA